MATLREINEELAVIFAEIEENEGELTEELDNQLKETFTDLEKKIDSYGEMMNALAVQSTQLDNEIKRLQAKKKTIDNTTKRIKEYLLFNMQMTGQSKLKGTFWTASVRNSKAVDIADVDTFTKEAREKIADIVTAYPWLTFKVEPSKTAISDMSKAGEELPSGATIVENQSVVIK